MPANATFEPAIDDPAEVAYWNHRKVVRRRQLVAFLVAAILILSFVVWKVARHMTATWWLEANHFDVLWAVEKDNWKQGGSTTVRFAGRNYFGLTGERPNLDLKFLKDLHHLEELDLSTLSGLRDADLATLDDLTALRRLSLGRSRQAEWILSDPGVLTEATFARIGQLTRLEALDLRGQRITDTGLKDIAGLAELRSLDLEGTKVTDASLERLKALRNLKSLDVTNTKVTAKGVADFESSRPGVRVLSDPPPMAPPKPK